MATEISRIITKRDLERIERLERQIEELLQMIRELAKVSPEVARWLEQIEPLPRACSGFGCDSSSNRGLAFRAVHGWHATGYPERTRPCRPARTGIYRGRCPRHSEHFPSRVEPRVALHSVSRRTNATITMRKMARRISVPVAGRPPPARLRAGWTRGSRCPPPPSLDFAPDGLEGGFARRHPPLDFAPDGLEGGAACHPEESDLDHTRPYGLYRTFANHPSDRPNSSS